MADYINIINKTMGSKQGEWKTRFPSQIRNIWVSCLMPYLKAPWKTVVYSGVAKGKYLIREISKELEGCGEAGELSFNYEVLLLRENFPKM